MRKEEKAKFIKISKPQKVSFLVEIKMFENLLAMRKTKCVPINIGEVSAKWKPKRKQGGKSSQVSEAAAALSAVAEGQLPCPQLPCPEAVLKYF